MSSVPDKQRHNANSRRNPKLITASYPSTEATAIECGSLVKCIGNESGSKKNVG